MTIVTSTYRYKRPPRKRANAVAIERSVIVTAKKPKPRKPGDPTIRHTSDASAPADTTAAPNDDRKSVIITTKPGKPMPVPTTEARRSAIVTARQPGKQMPTYPRSRRRNASAG